MKFKYATFQDIADHGLSRYMSVVSEPKLSGLILCYFTRKTRIDAAKGTVTNQGTKRKLFANKTANRGEASRQREDDMIRGALFF